MSGELPHAIPCRGCGAKLYMVRGPNGKFIPCSKVTKVYLTRADLASGELVLDVFQQSTRPEAPMLINHFQVCPKAERFSRAQQAQHGT